MRGKTRGYLNAFYFLLAEVSRLRKPVLADCLQLSLCSSFPRLMQCLETCNLYTTQAVPLTPGLASDSQRLRWLWWHFVTMGVWVKWLALSLNKSYCVLTAGSLGEQGSGEMSYILWYSSAHCMWGALVGFGMRKNSAVPATLVQRGAAGYIQALVQYL